MQTLPLKSQRGSGVTGGYEAIGAWHKKKRKRVVGGNKKLNWATGQKEGCKKKKKNQGNELLFHLLHKKKKSFIINYSGLNKFITMIWHYVCRGGWGNKAFIKKSWNRIVRCKGTKTDWYLIVYGFSKFRKDCLLETNLINEIHKKLGHFEN